jgi:hypothetical protein
MPEHARGHGAVELMNRDDAVTLYRLLRSICLLKSGSVLHIAGHTIEPLDEGEKHVGGITAHD